MLCDKLPVPKELVLLEDSDEDSETDLSEDSEFDVTPSSLDTSSDDDYLSVEERLEKLIGKSLEKYNVEYQCTAAIENLSQR